MAYIESSSRRGAALGAAFSVLRALGTGYPTGVIPISTEQWRRSLSDAEIGAHLTAWAAARNLVSSKATDDDSSLDRGLRPASVAFVEEVSRATSALRLLATFDPEGLGASTLADEWRNLLLEDAHVVLEAAVKKRRPPSAPDRVGQLGVAEQGDRDVLLEIFGVPADELVDEVGFFCDTRVLASYRLRLGELQSACDPVMGVVAECPPPVFSAVSAVRDLATSTSPFLTLWAARYIRSAILDAFEANPDRTHGVLRDAAENGDKEWESFRRMQRCLRLAEAANDSPDGTEAEFAVAILEAYRHMAEGITRRWVGVLLRLSGLEQPPGLGAIAEPAVSRLGELGTRIEAALVPAMRNAEAHDDFVFDEESGRLVSGDVEFDPQEILARLTDLDILQRGLIVGRLAAFSDQPKLADDFSGSMNELSPSSALNFARQRFGHAGQQVRSFVRDRDRLDVVIDGLQAEACNPCFVALNQTAHVLSNVSRFTVRVQGRGDPVIDLPAGVLRENWNVFEFAAQHFPDGLPQATFLPCLTWCRLACESQEDAARAAAWMALNDAQHAINDAKVSPREFVRLKQRLAVVLAATSSTARILPAGSSVEPIRRAERILRASTGTLGRPDPYGSVFDRILGVRDRIGGPPVVLPTLDQTRMDEEGFYPHPVA